MRLKGKHVLWPFGLHVTGTPIAACARKLTNEMAQYGNPPTFPEADADAPKPGSREARRGPWGAPRQEGQGGPPPSRNG